MSAPTRDVLEPKSVTRFDRQISAGGVKGAVLVEVFQIVIEDQIKISTGLRYPVQPAVDPKDIGTVVPLN